MKYLRFILILVMALGIFSNLPTQAAADPALVELAFKSALALDSYNNYQLGEQATEFEQRTYRQSGVLVSQSVTNKITNRTTTVVKGGTFPQASYLSTITVMQDNNVFTLAGELRLVDGILYGIADFLVGSSNDVVYPDTWVTISDPNVAGPFDIFDPNDLLVSAGVNPDNNPLNSLEIFQKVVANVTQVPSGTGSILTVEFNRTLYDLLFNSSPLLAKIGNGSIASYKFHLDASNTVQKADFFFRLELVGLDSSIDPSVPVGQTVDIVNIENRTVTLKSFNNPALSVVKP